MKFSIIVPVYNAAAFVADTIENLLKQNVDKEIILVNDGSSDNSLDILRSYESRYECIHVIDKPNGGVASARNKGLDYATGDYIIFVDSDDFIDESLLAECERIYKEYNPDVISFSYKFCIKRGDKMKEIPMCYKETGMYELKDWLGDYFTLENTHIMHCIGTKVYKRSIILEHSYKFDEETNYCEDIGFCTGYFAFVKKVYYLNIPAYHYRMINDNNRISKFKPHLSVSKEYLRTQQQKMFENIYGKNDLPKEIILKILQHDIIECLDNIFVHRNVPEAEVKSEIQNLSQIYRLTDCYRQTNSLHSKMCLYVLKNFDISWKIRLLSTCYAVWIPYNKCIGRYLLRINNKIAKVFKPA